MFRVQPVSAVMFRLNIELLEPILIAVTSAVDDGMVIVLVPTRCRFRSFSAAIGPPLYPFSVRVLVVPS